MPTHLSKKSAIRRILYYQTSQRNRCFRLVGHIYKKNIKRRLICRSRMCSLVYRLHLKQICWYRLRWRSEINIPRVRAKRYLGKDIFMAINGCTSVYYHDDSVVIVKFYPFFCVYALPTIIRRPVTTPCGSFRRGESLYVLLAGFTYPHCLTSFQLSVAPRTSPLSTKTMPRSMSSK